MPNDEELIGDAEKLYRGVIRNPNFWIEADNFPSTAIFKDSKGVSVDRDGGRDDCAIVKNMCLIKDFRALAMVTAKQCRDSETHPIPKKIPKNPFHAEIHDSPDKVKITANGKLRRLMQCVILIKTDIE